MKVSLVDYSFAAVDSKTRNMSFAFILKLKHHPSVAELHQGALSALQTFPPSNCKLQKYQWVRDEEAFGLEVREASDLEVDSLVESFMSDFLDIKKGRGVSELLIKTPSQNVLVAKFHHALCDGISALLWLSVQLKGNAIDNVQRFELKTTDKTVKKSKYAYSSRSDSFGSQKKNIGPSRHTLTMELNRPALPSAKESFTYNDFLVVVLLKSMQKWNAEKGLGDKKLSLYIPVNIRKSPFEGFGNGASRIKIYADKSGKLSVLDYCKHVREQVKWCRENGQWAIPDIMDNMRRCPEFLSAGLLNFMSKLPSSDFCSMLFSHMEGIDKIQGLNAEVKSVVAPLVKQYGMSAVAITEGKSTRLTFTWDPNLFTKEEIVRFQNIVKLHLEEFQAELAKT